MNEYLIYEGAYGRCLYESVPRVRKKEINKFFDKMLNYERGDAFLLVTRLRGDKQ
ncbi:MAG: hypothetical protein ABGW69_00215 [Nanoarchaeota archaeon]